MVIAVLDEGMQITHPDLAANIWVNPGEVAGDGIDNDGNGYADDVNGWDFYHRDSTVYDVGEDAHGTHVAGTIGATGNNGVGVAGVCSNVTIIPAKFPGPQGGYISDAITAMNYLVDLEGPLQHEARGREQLLGRRRLQQRDAGRHQPCRQGGHPVRGSGGQLDLQQ